MAEQHDEALFREIDEELRHDKAKVIWAAYGKYFVSVAVILLLAVIGFQGWKKYDLKNRNALGEKLAKAEDLAKSGDEQAALSALEDLAKYGSKGYALLARFRIAGVLAEKQNTAAAIDAYKNIAGDETVDVKYRDLAVILSAMQKLNLPQNDIADDKRLAEIAKANNPWHFSAREILATEAFRAGQIAKAREKFKSLNEEATTPAAIRDRAVQMLAIIGDK